MKMPATYVAGIVFIEPLNRERFYTDCQRRGFSFGANEAEMHSDSPRARRHRGGMDTDDLLSDLAWGLIRDWLRRRDVDPVTRRASQDG
jgi:hypothetical protein